MYSNSPNFETPSSPVGTNQSKHPIKKLIQMMRPLPENDRERGANSTSDINTFAMTEWHRTNRKSSKKL